MADTVELVAIGRIVKTFGVKGEVRVQSLSDVPGRFRGLREVTLEAPSGRALVTTVNRVREDRASYILGFEAFSSPEEAAEFRGGLIKIPLEQVPRLPEGQFYEFQLIGMTVVDESGRRLGTVGEILETGSNPVFVVRHEGREVLIPGTRHIVASVDVDGRMLTIRRVEGLLDEYDAL